jgi:hypothetical protein
MAGRTAPPNMAELCVPHPDFHHQKSKFAISYRLTWHAKAYFFQPAEFLKFAGETAWTRALSATAA